MLAPSSTACWAGVSQQQSTPTAQSWRGQRAKSLAEGYYFTIAFLDTVGYFDPAKRFWTDRAFPEAPALRARFERHVRRLHPNDPMARMALERLSPA